MGIPRKDGVDVCCEWPCKPGLFDRIPETRPEGLEWCDGWRIVRPIDSPMARTEWVWLSPTDAEERIIGRQVKVVSDQDVLSISPVAVCLGDIGVERHGRPLLHALVTAMHRWLDSKGGRDGIHT
jgi:hypothetical protein